jgi:hypothetical protein
MHALADVVSWATKHPAAQIAKTAHLFNGPKRIRILLICSGPSVRDEIARIPVASVREARAIAVTHNAKCWNF